MKYYLSPSRLLKGALPNPACRCPGYAGKVRGPVLKVRYLAKNVEVNKG